MHPDHLHAPVYLTLNVIHSFFKHLSPILKSLAYLTASVHFFGVFLYLLAPSLSLTNSHQCLSCSNTSRQRSSTFVKSYAMPLDYPTASCTCLTHFGFLFWSVYFRSRRYSTLIKFQVSVPGLSSKHSPFDIFGHICDCVLDIVRCFAPISSLSLTSLSLPTYSVHIWIIAAGFSATFHFLFPIQGSFISWYPFE